LRVLCQRRTRLHREGKNGRVEARRLAAAGGNGDIVGRLSSAEAAGKFDLPWKRVTLRPELAEERGEITGSQRRRIHLGGEPRGLQSP